MTIKLIMLVCNCEFLHRGCLNMKTTGQKKSTSSHWGEKTSQDFLHKSAADDNQINTGTFTTGH